MKKIHVFLLALGIVFLALTVPALGAPKCPFANNGGYSGDFNFFPGGGSPAQNPEVFPENESGAGEPCPFSGDGSSSGDAVSSIIRATMRVNTAPKCPFSGDGSPAQDPEVFPECEGGAGEPCPFSGDGSPAQDPEIFPENESGAGEPCPFSGDGSSSGDAVSSIIRAAMKVNHVL